MTLVSGIHHRSSHESSHPTQLSSYLASIWKCNFVASVSTKSLSSRRHGTSCPRIQTFSWREMIMLASIQVLLVIVIGRTSLLTSTNIHVPLHVSAQTTTTAKLSPKNLRSRRTLKRTHTTIFAALSQDAQQTTRRSNNHHPSSLSQSPQWEQDGDSRSISHLTEVSITTNATIAPNATDGGNSKRLTNEDRADDFFVGYEPSPNPSFHPSSSPSFHPSSIPTTERIQHNIAFPTVVIALNLLSTLTDAQKENLAQEMQTVMTGYLNTTLSNDLSTSSLEEVTVTMTTLPSTQRLRRTKAWINSRKKRHLPTVSQRRRFVRKPRILQEETVSGETISMQMEGNAILRSTSASSDDVTTEVEQSVQENVVGEGGQAQLLEYIRSNSNDSSLLQSISGLVVTADEDYGVTNNNISKIPDGSEGGDTITNDEKGEPNLLNLIFGVSLVSLAGLSMIGWVVIFYIRHRNFVEHKKSMQQHAGGSSNNTSTSLNDAKSSSNKCSRRLTPEKNRNITTPLTIRTSYVDDPVWVISDAASYDESEQVSDTMEEDSFGKELETAAKVDRQVWTEIEGMKKSQLAKKKFVAPIAPPKHDVSPIMTPTSLPPSHRTFVENQEQAWPHDDDNDNEFHDNPELSRRRGSLYSQPIYETELEGSNDSFIPIDSEYETERDSGYIQPVFDTEMEGNDNGVNSRGVIAPYGLIAEGDNPSRERRQFGPSPAPSDPDVLMLTSASTTTSGSSQSSSVEEGPNNGFEVINYKATGSIGDEMNARLLVGGPASDIDDEISFHSGRFSGVATSIGDEEGSTSLTKHGFYAIDSENDLRHDYITNEEYIAAVQAAAAAVANKDMNHQYRQNTPSLPSDEEMDLRLKPSDDAVASSSNDGYDGSHDDPTNNSDSVHSSSLVDSSKGSQSLPSKRDLGNDAEANDDENSKDNKLLLSSDVMKQLKTVSRFLKRYESKRERKERKSIKESEGESSAPSYGVFIDDSSEADTSTHRSSSRNSTPSFPISIESLKKGSRRGSSAKRQAYKASLAKSGKSQSSKGSGTLSRLEMKLSAAAKGKGKGRKKSSPPLHPGPFHLDLAHDEYDVPDPGPDDSAHQHGIIGEKEDNVDRTFDRTDDAIKIGEMVGSPSSKSKVLTSPPRPSDDSTRDSTMGNTKFLESEMDSFFGPKENGLHQNALSPKRHIALSKNKATKSSPIHHSLSADSTRDSTMGETKFLENQVETFYPEKDPTISQILSSSTQEEDNRKEATSHKKAEVEPNESSSVFSEISGVDENDSVPEEVSSPNNRLGIFPYIPRKMNHSSPPSKNIVTRSTTVREEPTAREEPSENAEPRGRRAVFGLSGRIPVNPPSSTSTIRRSKAAPKIEPIHNMNPNTSGESYKVNPDSSGESYKVNTDTSGESYKVNTDTSGESGIITVPANNTTSSMYRRQRDNHPKNNENTEAVLSPTVMRSITRRPPHRDFVSNLRARISVMDSNSAPASNGDESIRTKQNEGGGRSRYTNSSMPQSPPEQNQVGQHKQHPTTSSSLRINTSDNKPQSRVGAKSLISLFESNRSETSSAIFPHSEHWQYTGKLRKGDESVASSPTSPHPRQQS